MDVTWTARALSWENGDVPDERESKTYAPGHQPYDRLVGMRVGVLVGGVLGIGATAVTGGAAWWAIPLGAAVGGLLGHRLADRW